MFEIGKYCISYGIVVVNIKKETGVCVFMNALDIQRIELLCHEIFIRLQTHSLERCPRCACGWAYRVCTPPTLSKGRLEQDRLALYCLYILYLDVLTSF